MPRRKKSGAEAGKPVVIVESPAKAKTILGILGPGYVVKACMGHVRDLPARGFGVDVENGFAPTWRTLKGKAASLAWGTVHLALLSTGEDRAKAMVEWTWAGFTHERAGRISVRTDT